MHIAIIGAGFSGLATAYHLLKEGKAKVDIFDRKGVGGGASGIAAGLLHPYPGAESKLNYLAHEGLAATKLLLNVSENALGEKVFASKGMLRPATTLKQLIAFQRCATDHPEDVKWLTQKECESAYPQLFPHLLPHPGIFIQSTLTIDCKRYLQGLALACQKLGAKFEIQTIKSLVDLKEYDTIVAATGAFTATISELTSVPLQLFKGQILNLKPKDEISAFPFPLNSHAYLLMNEKEKMFTAGATFEHKYVNDAPDIDYAASDLLPKISAFLPIFTRSDIIECRSSIRAVSPTRRPYIEKINDKCWVITAMGAKGLLYHALYAQELAQQMLKK